jgi:Zn-dependent protease with chaperone function
MEVSSDLFCPECRTPLPAERRKTPWCDCGWSSAVDEWLSDDVPPSMRNNVRRQIRYAQWLAKADDRAMGLTEHRWGRLLWHAYLVLTVLLCLPIILITVVVWAVPLGLLIYALAVGARSLAFLLFLVIAVMILYVIFAGSTRSRNPAGINLTRQSAAQLFQAIDQVAVQLRTPSLDTARLDLSAGVGIGQRLAWRSGLQLKPELSIGLLACQTLTMTQLEAVLAHELAHLHKRDTLWLLLVGSSVSSLYEWIIGLSQVARASLEAHSLIGLLAWLLGSLALILLKPYFYFLVWVSRWAMRRQEYEADRAAAEVYGSKALLQAIVTAAAASIRFNEQYSTMIQRMKNRQDERNLFAQFAEGWQRMPGTVRQAIYAKAVASIRSVYDTHPSYQDRRRALARLADPSDSASNDSAAIALLPNSDEYGQVLTDQLLHA